ncbi:hypothetical protein GCM10009679_55880 [Saccharothrix algeriensis]|uniref:DUF11 domain-containing protein n=2 Tax=Catellatospora bangladeshensis TaxID=310355 RepID=A0A8J3JL80_9ACTN|nr:hypothetical protein Cba03nite_40220 [Catellatospora bangladeshensis]
MTVRFVYLLLTCMYRFLRALAGLCLAAAVIVLPGSPAHAAAGQYTFSTGTMAPGASKTWHWNNADAGLAYRVGLSPQGATPTSTCEFEVTREWYEQRLNSGVSELEYWFTVTNVGDLACSATALLSWIGPTAKLGPTASAPAGQRAGTWYYYDSDASTTALVVALIPSGATSAAPCRWEVGRIMQITNNEGERRHGIAADNVGSITCQAEVRVYAIAASSTWSTGSMAPASTKTWHWNNANPLTAVYAVSLRPDDDIPFFSIERTWYVQRINSGGAAEREFYLTVRHYSSPGPHSAQVLLARVY